MRHAAPSLAVLLIAGCSAVPTASRADASSTRTISPPVASSSPNAVLNPGNCTGSFVSVNPTPTMTRASGGISASTITLKIPPGWSDHTKEVTGVSALLYIEAPGSYGADNATLMLVAVPGPRQGSSSHEQAVEDAAGQASLGAQSVSDCIVGGEKASFYPYQFSTGERGYRLLILHCPLTRYPPLYSIVISGQGQIDNRAAADVRGILGSWNWGSNVCDLYHN